MADLPLSKLASSAPEYETGPGSRRPRPSPPARCRGRPDRRAAGPRLVAQLRHESLVFRQYDGPGHGGHDPHAGRGRGNRAEVHGTRRGAGLHLRRHAALFRGEPLSRRQAGGGGSLPNLLILRRAASSRRRTTSISATPRSPTIMGQFVGAIRASARLASHSTCRIVVRQRLALQRDRRSGDPAPLPTIGAVGPSSR